MEFGFFVLFGLFVVGKILYDRARSREFDQEWRTAARELGVRFYGRRSEWERRLGGTVAGFPVSARAFKEGNHHKTEFAVRLTSPLPFDFQLTRRSFRSAIANLFGTGEIELGDEAFSSGIVVRGAGPASVRDYLTNARRARIRRAFQSFPYLRIESGGLFLTRKGQVENARIVVSTIRQLTHLARTLLVENPEDEALGQAVEAQRRGLLADALSILQLRREQLERASPTEASAPAVEETVLEANLLYLADRPDEAKQAYARALQDSPDDEEIRGWTDHVSSPLAPVSTSADSDSVAKESVAPPEESAPAPGTTRAAPQDSARALGEPATAPEESVATREESASASEDSVPAREDSSIEVASLCDAVFGSTMPSFESARLFEEKFQGRVVRWTGVLKTVSQYSYDFVFGSGPGTRAAFEVHTIRINTYSDRKVLAVVQLPEDAFEMLAGREGRPSDFTGVLHKVDAYMKNVFLTDGSLG